MSMVLETELKPTIPIQNPLNNRWTNKLIKKKLSAKGIVLRMNRPAPIKMTFKAELATSLLNRNDALNSAY